MTNEEWSDKLKKEFAKIDKELKEDPPVPIGHVGNGMYHLGDGVYTGKIGFEQFSEELRKAYKIKQQ